MRRSFLPILLLFTSASLARAQSVNLTEAPLAQRCVRNELTLELDGKILVKQGDKENAFPHKAQARHVYMERFLDVNGAVADKAARFYTAAESTVRFNNDAPTKRTLRAQRHFLVAQRIKDQLVSFSPDGTLTREEMELTEHLDTMSIGGLLPGKTVEVGKSWPIPNAIVGTLCDLDGLTGHNLEGKLEAIKGNQALVKIVGNASGINLGAQVALIVNARLEFDLKAQCITHVEWHETDKRQQGPVTPALDADVTLKLTRTPIAEPVELSKFALVKVPTEAPPVNLLNLTHADAKKRFTLNHARAWHVVSPEDSPQLVMRYVERGEFLGQVTITTWKKVDPKSAMSLADFAALTEKTPGWAVDKEIERKTLDNPPRGQHAVHRVVASGELDGTRTVQYFYLIVGANGDQLITTFSVVPTHVQRLGSRDLELVREVGFVD